MQDESSPLYIDPWLRRFREYVTAALAGIVVLGTMVMVAFAFASVNVPDTFNRAKDLLLFLNPLVGLVIGYYFSKVSSEGRAESAEATCSTIGTTCLSEMAPSAFTRAPRSVPSSRSMTMNGMFSCWSKSSTCTMCGWRSAEVSCASAREAAPGNDVHVAIYGWGLEAVYTSALSAWPITDALFQRIYDPERRPFWESIPLGEEVYRVHFSNDRAGIYAIGYPQLTLFDHFVHLAEVSTLAGAAFVLVLLATAVFTRLSRERPRVGRALLREIRASFYRKLFLAFVLASLP